MVFPLYMSGGLSHTVLSLFSLCAVEISVYQFSRNFLVFDGSTRVSVTGHTCLLVNLSGVFSEPDLHMRKRV